MKENYSSPGFAIRGGDITVCPSCKKKFVVVPDKAGHTSYKEGDTLTCPHCKQMILADVLLERADALAWGGELDGKSLAPGKG